VEQAAATTAAQIRQLENLGARVVVIGNNPDAPGDPIECLARHDDIARCSAPASRAVPPIEEATVALGRALDALGSDLDGRFLDPVPLICATGTCLVDDGITIIYSDGNHLTGEFALRAAPALAELLATD
jgi:hypothetical protein